MRSWKLAIVLALATLNFSNLTSLAAEPVALPKTINDDAVTLKGEAQYRKINEVTEQNVADIMAVPTDMADLATHHGRDFEYTPVIHDKVVGSTAKGVVLTPSTSLTYTTGGRLQPASANDQAEVQQTLAGKADKQYIQ